MALLNQSDIQQLWVRNGGKPQLAPTMSAIAMAESGGNTTSLNNNPQTGDYSVGLWQINYFDGMLGPRTRSFGSPQQLAADPNRQAKAAVNLAADGTGLTNWSTYSNGAYRQYLGGGTGGGPGGTVPTSGQGIAQLASVGTAGNVNDTCLLNLPSLGPIGGGCLFRTNNARALAGGSLVWAGVVLMLGGIVLVVTGSSGGTVAGVALKALPGGSVVGGAISRRGRPSRRERRAVEQGEENARRAPRTSAGGRRMLGSDAPFED